MNRPYNFSAGPATMPLPVLEQIRSELLDWNNTGTSVMEVSHRGADFIAMAAQSEVDLRRLMSIPDNYKVLFLQGGAQSQFSMVPLNLLGNKTKVDYINTGQWSKKAIAEAKRYADVNIVASSEDTNFTTIPDQNQWQLSSDAAYVHYTPNETIGGVEFHWVPETGDVPLVADMSSNILSRPIDVSKFGLIYAGAQKNVGPAGITLVIVRDDLLGRTSSSAPGLFNYQNQADNDSMLNTVPTFAWYAASLVFKWLLEQGGVQAMATHNQTKAGKLYDYIDNSNSFYANPVEANSRSRMNVPFTLHDANLDGDFLSLAAQAGLHSLKGHRSVGGMRASIYNAMPEAGIDALIQFMDNFKNTNT